MLATRIPDGGAEHPAEPGEAELVGLLLAGDREAFELLMRRNNQRLFRVARAIVLEDAEAEDVVQAAYLAAFRGVARFAGRSSLATWLTRIVINEALARRRERLRHGTFANAHELADELGDRASNPEDSASLQELTRLTESAIDGLPANYRLVLVLRQIEGLSGEETAASLGLTEQVVRVRLHRARAMLREQLGSLEPNAAPLEPFGFAGERCNRIVDRVLSRAPTTDARAAQ
jgi:RNA polymerase sigma-70 factor (ECF subfamily)